MSLDWIELIADGLQFPESPFWSQVDDCLYLVEWTGDRVLRCKDGWLKEVFRTEAGSGPSGLCQDTVLSPGNFWLCLYSGRKLVQYSPQGILLQAITAWRERPFRGPNDVVVDELGGVYFTDGGDFDEDWETGRPAGAVYFLSPAGELLLIDGNLCFPNGIALALDGKSLYVAEHRQNRVLRYELTAPGRAANKQVFYALDGECLLEPDAAFELGPDGMCVDNMDRLWVAHYGGGKLICLSPRGEVLRVVRLPRGRRPTNAAHHPVQNALYITEAEFGLLYRLALDIPTP